MKKTFFITLLAFACILAIAPSALAKTAAFNPVSKKVLAIPQKYIKKGVLVDFKLNKNATNAAYIIEKKSGRKTQNFVVFNGIAGKKYDIIDMLTFSPDGKKVFYRAKNTEPEAEFFVETAISVETTVNATKAKKISGIIESLYTPGWGFPFLNDNPVYFTTSKKGIHTLFVGDEEIPYAHRAFFNKNHTKMGYIYDYAHDDGTKGHQVIVDGKAGKTYMSIYDYQFNDDGTVSYVADNEDEAMLVRDEVEIISYAYPNRDGNLWAKISPDGKNVLMRYRRQINKDNNAPEDFDEYVIFNTRKGERHDGSWNDGILAFGPDSKAVAYTITQDYAVNVVDEREGTLTVKGFYSEINDIIFSDDSKHMAFVGKSVTEKYSRGFFYTNPAEIVVDGEVIQRVGFDEKNASAGIYDLAFSPKSNVVLYTIAGKESLTRRLFAGSKEIKDKNRLMTQFAPFVFDNKGEYVGFGAVKINPKTNEWEIWWVAEKL